MTLSQRLLTVAVALVMGLSGMTVAQTRTTPSESLNGLRPGVTVDQLVERLGKPDMTDQGGLLELYGGPAESEVHGWFLIDNPTYTVPDLAVETAAGSDRIDLVMAIGYDGLRTEKGLTCFMTEDELIEAYGQPDFVFAVPMQGFVLREFYYVKQGISFDVAPVGPGTTERQIIAIYVTYPEFLTEAVKLRQTYINDGVGRDITSTYRAGSVT